MPTTTPPSETHDYTIKARIIKQTSDGKSLAGAKFRLLNSDKTKAAVIADGKIQSWDAVDKGTVFTTGDDGVFAFAGIDVDEDYYLEETEAPVLNDTGILGLPSTGGMGTVMLYVAGGSLILAAGYALYRRKKVSDAE